MKSAAIGALMATVGLCLLGKSSGRCPDRAAALVCLNLLGVAPFRFRRAALSVGGRGGGYIVLQRSSRLFC